MNISSIMEYALRLLTVAFSLLLLSSCFYALFSDTSIMVFDLLALVLPYLVLVNFILGFVNSLLGSRVLFFPFTSLIIWIFTLGPFIVFTSDDEAPVDGISVLTYNVFEFIGNYSNRPLDMDSKIADFILKQDPDVICFQESGSTKVTREKLKEYVNGYSYSSKGTKKYSPMAIYSKYPMVSKGSLDFPNSINNALFADLVATKDTIRIYNLHLQSLRFMPGSIKKENPLHIFRRLGQTIAMQKTQVDLILRHMKSSPYPIIVCGDFNNTQYSRVYRMLKQGMKDSFREKGNGMGTTLHFKFLPFRIDFVMADPQFEVMEHRNFDVEYSDHYPVMATFRYQPR